MKVYPAITLYQPWATWIMRGWKTIETRTHGRFSILFGQTILIHAGMKTDDSYYTTQNPYLTREQIMYKPHEVINGYLLGTARVASCARLDDSHSQRALIECKHTERFGLFLEDITPFEKPIPCKGSMGIWYYDLESMKPVKLSEVKQANFAPQQKLF